MGDKFAYWKAHRRGEKPPVDVNSPQCGYYKFKRGKDGPFIAVLVNIDKQGKLFACTLEKERRSLDPLEVWTWLANRSISQEDAKYYHEHGKFPGDVPEQPVKAVGNGYPSTAAASERAATPTPPAEPVTDQPAPPPPQGHNLKDGELPLNDQCRDLCENAVTWLRGLGEQIETQQHADMAANYRDQILAMRKKVDAHRVALKKPHDDAAKDVQKMWKPFVDLCDEANKLIRAPLSRFMAAEETRLEDEAAARVAEIQETNPGETVVTTSKPKVQAGGQRGAKQALKTRKVVVIEDLDQVLEHFKHQRPVVLAKLLQHQAVIWLRENGTLPPGCVEKEERSL